MYSNLHVCFILHDNFTKDNKRFDIEKIVKLLLPYESNMRNHN